MSVENLLNYFPLDEKELSSILALKDRFDHLGERTGLLCQDEETTNVETNFVPEFSQFLSFGVEQAFTVGCHSEDEMQAKFLEACVSLMGRRNEQLLIKLFHKIASQRDGPIVQSLNDLLFRFSEAFDVLTQSGSTTKLKPTSGEARCEPILLGSEMSESDWCEWVYSTAPALPRLFSTVLHFLILDGSADPTFRVGPFEPVAMDEDSIICSKPDLVAMSCFTLGGQWKLLGTSARDGLSIEMIQCALLSYYGPTVLLLRVKTGETFGYYTEIPWKSSKKWAQQNEGSDCFLFGLSPSWKLLSRTGDDTFLQYLRVRSKTHPDSDHLSGIAVGAVASDTPRLHVTESLEHCRFSSVMDRSFHQGPLLRGDSPFFDVDAAEIWAVHVSSEEDFNRLLAKGAERSQIQETVRKRASVVDKTAFVEDFAIGLLDPTNKLYVHRDQARGRAEFVVGDKGDYYVEGKQPINRNAPTT